MFHPKHVELFAGNKILYKKCQLVGIFLKRKVLLDCLETGKYGRRLINKNG
jgi:hypothetical protein